MNLADRLLTIVITATVTSAAWIVYGGGFVETGSPERSEANGAGAPPAPAGAPDEAASGEGLLIPVAGIGAEKLRDSFAHERAEGERVHEAIDIMAPRGTEVVAAAPGTIERLFASRAGGNTIYLRSADRRTIHYYAHLDGYAPGLKEGQQVARGQALGTVGSTGNASDEGPHLHFAVLRTEPDAEWWEPATAVNPYPLLRGS